MWCVGRFKHRVKVNNVAGAHNKKARERAYRAPSERAYPPHTFHVQFPPDPTLSIKYLYVQLYCITISTQTQSSTLDSTLRGPLTARSQDADQGESDLSKDPTNTWFRFLPQPSGDTHPCARLRPHRLDRSSREMRLQLLARREWTKFSEECDWNRILV